ncbi:CaiB/BaiF CoA transferase family protein [Cumulibacter manganitolerans]|uniref:CaiB/BaiF CoA transferase family protein n=1 Tax=Cumulibacter manganitolerans TaxID=1884992 RepID=UPI0012965645|nr:CoA transferase [Cumulibacter manganitolerans]
MGGPLDGVRILDLTRVVMGPYATQILADQGADVIMIENADPDTNRMMGGGPHEELSGVALNLLRNKRSVVLDLKSDHGRESVRKLAATCDVVVASMRPAALERLGVAYEQLREVKEDLVYCQAQGFPLASPERDAAAYDDVIQAASGVADISRKVYGEGYLLPTIFADKVSGMAMAQAISAALFQRERTGKGCHIEVAMQRTASSFLLVEHGSKGITEPPMGEPGYSRIMTTERRVHPTSDGMIHVLPYQPKHYDALFASVDWPELADRSRYATPRDALENSDSLYRDVRRVMATRSTEEWMAFCAERSIPAARVATLEGLVQALPVEQHPVVGGYHVTDTGAYFDGAGAELRRHAPLLGQDTDEVLGEL